MKISSFLLPLILLTPLVPWLFPDNRITDMQEICLTAGVGLLTFLSAFRRTTRYSISLAEVLLLCACGWFIIACLTRETFAGWLYQTRHIVVILFLYFEVRTGLQDEGRNYLEAIPVAFTLLATICTGYSVVMVAGALLHSGNIPPDAITPTGNSGLYAIFLTILLPFAWLHCINPQRNALLVVFGWALLGGGAITILALQSRTAWIMAAVIVLAGTWFYFPKSSTRRIAVAIWGAILVMVIWSSAGFKKDSATGRSLIYKVTAGMVKDHWAGGMGLNKFKSAYLHYQGEYLLRHDQNNIYRNIAGNVHFAFNEYLQFFVEAGIVPFILLLMGGAAAFPALLRSPAANRPLLAVGLTGVGGIGIAALFSYPLHDLSCSMVFSVCVAFIFHAAGQSKTRVRPTEKKLNPILVLAVLPWWLHSARHTWYSKTWKEADFYMQTGQHAKAIPLFRRQFQTFRLYDKFLYDFARSAYAMEQFATADSLLIELNGRFAQSDVLCLRGLSQQQLGRHEAALRDFLAAHRAIPGKVWPQYLLMQCYAAKGDSVQAMACARVLLQSPVKVHSEKTAYMRAEALALLSQLSSKSQETDSP